MSCYVGEVTERLENESQRAGVPSSCLRHSMWVFLGGRNGGWVGFSRGIFLFPLPQISFHLLEIGSVIFSNISLVLRVTQCCAIRMLLSSLFHDYGDFPSQIRYYLLCNSMRLTEAWPRGICFSRPFQRQLQPSNLTVRMRTVHFHSLDQQQFIRGITHLNCHYQLTIRVRVIQNITAPNLYCAVCYYNSDIHNMYRTSRTTTTSKLRLCM